MHRVDNFPNMQSGPERKHDISMLFFLRTMLSAETSKDCFFFIENMDIYSI